MLKTISGLLIILTVFGGIFYYSVTKDSNAYYEARLGEAYSGRVLKKDIFRKGTQSEIPRMIIGDSLSYTISKSLYNTVHINDSIHKNKNEDSTLIWRQNKIIVYKIIKPKFFTDKNYEVIIPTNN